MTDLRIRHCDLLIRRRAEDGAAWADAEDHKRLAGKVQALVLRSLEELLAPRLEGLDEDVAPISLAVDLRLDKADLSGATPLGRLALRARIKTALEAGLAALPDAEVQSGAQAKASVVPTVSASESDTPEDISADPLSTISSLLHRGQLGAALAALSTERLVWLLQKLIAVFDVRRPEQPAPSIYSPPEATTRRAPERATRQATRQALSQAITQLVAVAREGRTDAASGRHAEMAGSYDLAAVATAAAALLAQITDEAKSTQVKVRDAQGSGSEGNAQQADVNLSQPAVHRSRSTPQAPSNLLRNGRYPLASALPFLLLGPLARHSVLDAMAIGVTEESDLQALAFCIAATTLPVGMASVEAAAFAGCREPVSGARVSTAAHRDLAPAEMSQAAIAAVLAGGLQPRHPLPVLADGKQTVVFDPCGLYPIYRGGVERQSELLAATGEFLILAEADAALMARLDRAGLPVVAPGPPVRGERWAEIRVDGWVGHSNRPQAEFASLRVRLAEAARLSADGAGIWPELTKDRGLVAEPARDCAVTEFLRSAAIIAGFALADIGWTLHSTGAAGWEESNPILLRDRFGDLSGWLEVDPGRITVALPLGRRFTDLRDAGLLDNVTDVPWWPGRIMSFRGG